jgi:hypothetical protein
VRSVGFFSIIQLSNSRVFGGAAGKLFEIIDRMTPEKYNESEVRNTNREKDLRETFVGNLQFLQGRRRGKGIRS